MLNNMGSTPGSPTRLNFAAAWQNRKVLFMLLISTALLSFVVMMFWQFGDICADGTYCHNFASFKPAPSLHSEAESAVSSLALAVPESTPAPENDQEDQQAAQTEPASPNPTDTDSADSEPAITEPTDPTCEKFPDTSNILLVMKTGASESYSKIPTQLLTNLRCLDDFLIFSDMEQTVAGAHIQDSLDTVLPEAMSGNKDFDLYNRQKTCAVDQETCNKNSGADTAGQGWALDKYKNIHMAEKAYEQRPDYDWYMFVDADTYVLWGTLVDWLKQLNPEDKHYLGSVALLGGFPFAHGGSGYLVSRGMMAAFLKDKTGIANQWDVPVKSTCCGDYMFSFALKNETEVDVRNVAPTINGEKPYTLAYKSNQWCHPIVTMHHIGSEEVSAFHDFEVERGFASPLRIKDIFHRFVEPQLVPTRVDWDNLSDDTLYFNTEAGAHTQWQEERRKKDGLNEEEQRAHLSVADCATACHSVNDCMQYSFSDGVCTTSRSIKHGHPLEPNEDIQHQRISGWDIENIQKWVRENEHCDGVSWPNV